MNYYQITREQYNYMLAVCREKLSDRNGRYYFIGSYEDYLDFLNRCKYMY